MFFRYSDRLVDVYLRITLQTLSVLTQGLPNVTVVCQYCTREPSFHTMCLSDIKS